MPGRSPRRRSQHLPNPHRPQRRPMTPCPPDPTLNQDTAMTSSTASAKHPRIAIIAYGSQGRAPAPNLPDSGFAFTVALHPGGPTEARAKAAGFGVKTRADGVDWEGTRLDLQPLRPTQIPS